MNTAERLFQILKTKNEKIVFAESCTCGLAAATMGEIPGVSECFCGSFVGYRADQKIDFGVSPNIIEKHTTESIEVAEDFASVALWGSHEPHWGAAIVGHLGPNAPEEKDGKIYISCVNRKVGFRAKSKTASKVITLDATIRKSRMIEAVDEFLNFIIELIQK